MTNRTPRKSAADAAVRIVVMMGVLLLTALIWRELSEPNALTSGASEPTQYSYLAYSGEDIWHAFPFGR